NSDVIWKKKGSSNTSKVDLSAVKISNLNKNVKRYSRKDLLECNNSHLGETSSASVCKDAMNGFCNSRMNDLLDDNNFFIFDDESVKISPVSKMPFRKKPCDSMNVRFKSNMIKSLPRTIVQICLWIIDSGCSKHMMGNRALLMNFVEKFLRTVRFGNNDFAMIAGYGDVVIGSMTIKKFYYVEGLGHNLFSVGQFFDKGLEVAFRKSTCFVQNEDGVDLLTGDRSLNFYTIALNEVASNSSTCLLEKASSSQSWLWHQRLSHLNFATINNLVKKNLVQGLPKMKFKKDHLCSACEQGKIHRKHHKSKTAFASNKPLYLLHIDLTPQQNGIVEKRNRTLVEAARTMLTFVNLPSFLWAEAIATACFTQNRSIIHKRFDKTPYELMNKRKPNIKFFRVFGCRCYLLNDYEDVGKLKAKGDIGVFVGYSKESAAFRIYNKRTRKIHESVNVNFDELSEMASKQFSLEPGLSKLNETRKSSNLSVLQVSEASKKDLEDLFQDFYDEYFDSSKIMKSLTTNVESSNVAVSSPEE
nr:integrase, catalytic region, zinc finger, CCHC-type, peptidase aspartic, catalytic [Tanacetum cinerariifolium]